METSTPWDYSVRAVGQTAQASIDGVLIWPSDGAVGVLTHMGAETPDPVPNIDSGTLGTPASLSVDYWKTIHVLEFSLKDDRTGVDVPVALLTHDNDPNSVLYPNFVGAIPLQPLTRNTGYRVHFSGTIAPAPGAEAQPYQRDWMFTTGDVDFPPVGN